jgi:hypothetical protein
MQSIACQAVDDQVALVGDPFGGEQALEQRLVEAAPCAVIDVLWTGAHMAQPGRAHAGLEALGLTAGDLAVDQQAKPFGVAEIGSSVLNLQFDEGFGHIQERVRATPAPRSLLVGWQDRICLQAIAGGLAETSLGSGNRNGLGLSERHEEPRLLISDMAARHERSPKHGKIAFYLNRSRPSDRPLRAKRGFGAPPVGLRPPYVPPNPRSHPD